MVVKLTKRISSMSFYNPKGVIFTSRDIFYYRAHNIATLHASSLFDDRALSVKCHGVKHVAVSGLPVAKGHHASPVMASALS